MRHLRILLAKIKNFPHFYYVFSLIIVNLVVFIPSYPSVFTSTWGQDLEINWIYQYQLKQNLPQNGSMPLWSPYTLGGYPMGSSNVAGLFYPLQVLFWLLPISFTFNLLTILHLTILGINMYFLTYLGFRLSKQAAFIAAVSLMLTPRIFNDLFLGHLNWLESLAWLPLALLLFIKTLEKRTYFLAVSTGLILSLMVYTFSILYIYALFVLGFYFTFFLASLFLKTRKLLLLLKPILMLLVVVLSSLTFCAIFLFSFLNFIPNSLRVQLTFWDSAFPSIYRESLTQLFYLLPDRIHQGETLLYLGVPTMILSVIGVARNWKNWQIWCLLSLIIFALTVSFGANEIFFKVYYRIIPVFQIMRNPLRIWTILAFGTAILSGFGANYLLNKYKKRAGGIFVTIVILVVSSLWIYNKEYFQLTNYATKHTELYEQLATDGRVYCITNCLADSEGIRKGFSFSNGGEGVLLDNYYQFMKLAGNWKYESTSISIPPYQITDPKSIYYEQPQPDATLLGLAQTKYIISPYELTDSNLVLKTKIEDKYVYENQKILPRAFLVPNSVKLNSIGQLKTLDLKNTVGLTGVEKDTGNPGEFKAVNVESTSSDRLHLQVSTDTNGFLVINDTYYPGWKAFDNGQEIPVYKANGTFRAIPVSKGSHQIILRYLPDSFVWGTLISLVALAGYAVWSLKKLISFFNPSSKRT